MTAYHAQLRDSQRDFLRLFVRLTRDHGVPPTRRELAAELGVRSTGAVHYRLERLERRGLIERTAGGSARCIVLTPAGYQAVGLESQADTIARLRAQLVDRDSRIAELEAVIREVRKDVLELDEMASAAFGTVAELWEAVP